MKQTAERVRQIAAEQAAGLGGLVPPALRALYVERLAELHGLGYLSMTAIYRQIVNELRLDGGHRRLHPRRMTTDFERRLAALPDTAQAGAGEQASCEQASCGQRLRKDGNLRFTGEGPRL